MCNKQGTVCECIAQHGKVCCVRTIEVVANERLLAKQAYEECKRLGHETQQAFVRLDNEFETLVNTLRMGKPCA